MSATSSISCGSFDLLEEIGRGEMAQVWRGVHRAQQIPVAIKVITAAKATDPDYVAAFQREVRAVAGLEHPGIVTVFDYGRLEAAAAAHPLLVAGSPYLVMELTQAGTLRDVRWPPSWKWVRDVVFELLGALAHAHARGVIHRDIKPANILANGSEASAGRFQISDFGLAHTADEGASAARVAGTPEYMSPEQQISSIHARKPSAHRLRAPAASEHMAPGAGRACRKPADRRRPRTLRPARHPADGTPGRARPGLERIM